MAMATNTEEKMFECRMYEPNYPGVGTVVMVKVRSVEEEMGACVTLVEYNNAEGLILLSELCSTRIRSVGSVIKVGKLLPAIVLNVDKKKGHIDLSKKRVSKKDVLACEERFSKSKFVHSIMRHVAKTIDHNLEDLYIHVGWPLYRKFGHAFVAFKLIRTNPDSILNSLTRREVKEVGPDGQEVTKLVIDYQTKKKKKTKLVPAVSDVVKNALVVNIRNRMRGWPIKNKKYRMLKNAFVVNIRNRMMPRPWKIRADIEITCFEFDGILRIKEAMKRAEATGTKDCPVKFQIVAAPLYVCTTHALDKEEGILVLTNAIKTCKEVIESYKGELEEKKQPQAVSETRCN